MILCLVAHPTYCSRWVRPLVIRWIRPAYPSQSWGELIHSNSLIPGMSHLSISHSQKLQSIFWGTPFWIVTTHEILTGDNSRGCKSSEETISLQSLVQSLFQTFDLLALGSWHLRLPIIPFGAWNLSQWLGFWENGPINELAVWGWVKTYDAILQLIRPTVDQPYWYRSIVIFEKDLDFDP